SRIRPVEVACGRPARWRGSRVPVRESSLPAAIPEASGRTNRSLARSFGAAAQFGDEGPKTIGAARQHLLAQPGLPVALAAEFIAPAPQPPAVQVEPVFAGYADGAMDLVGDGQRLAGGFAATGLGGGNQSVAARIMERVHRHVGGPGGYRGLGGQ